MRTKIIIASIFIGGFSVFAQAASFDCNKAATATEKLICGDEALSLLDEQLSSDYKKILANVKDKNVFKWQQVEWLKVRNSCKDVACLKNTYGDRIGELNNYSQEYKQESVIKETMGLKSHDNIGDEKKLPQDFFIKNIRPADVFQIVSSSNDDVCADVLTVLNQPGIYQGKDEIYWWISNNNLAKWSVLEKGVQVEQDLISPKNYVPMQLEEFSADLDGDGVIDYAYRYNPVYSSHYFQHIEVFNSDLKIDDSMDENYLAWKCNLRPNNCEVIRNNFNKRKQFRALNFIEGAKNSPRNVLTKKWASLMMEDIYVGKAEDELWFSNFIKIGNRYGLISYPQSAQSVKVIYSNILKDERVAPQCMFSPKNSININ